MMLKFYFRHQRNRLISVTGIGPQLPEMTHLRIEVDAEQNPSGARELRSSYLIEDPFGIAISGCYWSADLDMLSTCLTTLWWRESGQPSSHEKFVVRRIYHSDFHLIATNQPNEAVAA